MHTYTYDACRVYRVLGGCTAGFHSRDSTLRDAYDLISFLRTISNTTVTCRTVRFYEKNHFLFVRYVFVFVSEFAQMVYTTYDLMLRVNILFFKITLFKCCSILE